MILIWFIVQKVMLQVYYLTSYVTHISIYDHFLTIYRRTNNIHYQGLGVIMRVTFTSIKAVLRNGWDSTAITVHFIALRSSQGIETVSIKILPIFWRNLLPPFSGSTLRRQLLILQTQPSVSHSRSKQSLQFARNSSTENGFSHHPPKSLLGFQPV
jgi:hypothetical protein